MSETYQGNKTGEHLSDQPDDEDALGQFPCPLPQGVGFMVAVEGAMLRAKNGIRGEHKAQKRRQNNQQVRSVAFTLAGSKSGG